MRLVRFVRRRLHRRIFAWFTASILLTVLVTSLASSLLARGFGPGWDFRRAERFVGRRFEEVWADRAAKDHLARAIHDELGFGVTLEDERGAMSFGPPCRAPYWLAVGPGPRALGRVGFCGPRHKGLLQGALGFLLATLGIWAGAHFVARRITRPLGELSEVAGRIGAGDLRARSAFCAREADEVGSLARSIEDMANRIGRQLDTQKELLAVVSHELRTPLGHLRIIAELLPTADPAARTKLLADLDAEVTEIDRLVGELLDQGRLDFGQLDRRTLELRPLVEQALARKGRPAALAAVAPDLSVSADATLLSRALANLIDNAEKHGRGLTGLVAERRGDAIEIAALDQGPGLGDLDPAALFVPFRSQAAPRSLGLGLSLVRRIAEAHGGRVFAEDRPGGGAKIGLSLPAGA